MNMKKRFCSHCQCNEPYYSDESWSRPGQT